MNFHRMFHRFMSEAAEGDASGHSAPPAGNQGAADTDTPDEAEIAATAAIEAEASKMGWTPKSEFKGDPAKWRPADEFVERGKNMLPIVQASNKRLEREVAELRQTTKEFADHLSKTEQRAYERALADLKQQRKEAIAAGDGETFDKVDEAIADLKKEADAKAAKGADKAGPADDPVYAEWESRQTWLKDPDMAEYGEFAASKLRAAGEKATGADFLELVTKKVKAQFPEKFENPRRAAAPAVEGAAPAQRKGGKSYADMPADARAACDRMAKNGFGGDAKAAAEFKANFVKTHFEEA